MKFFQSIIFAFAFLFLAFTPASAGWSGCIDANRCTSGASGSGAYCQNPDYHAISQQTGCNAGFVQCDCVPNGGGGGGSGDGSGNGGGLTNIDAQAKSFFAYQSFDKFIPNLLQIALILGAIAAFAFLVWGGIDYIISGGNQERVKTSKTMIGNALTGLAILAAVWVIWRLITYFLGLSSTTSGPFKINFPTP